MRSGGGCATTDSRYTVHCIFTFITSFSEKLKKIVIVVQLVRDSYKSYMSQPRMTYPQHDIVAVDQAGTNRMSHVAFDIMMRLTGTVAEMSDDYGWPFQIILSPHFEVAYFLS